MPGSA